MIHLFINEQVRPGDLLKLQNVSKSLVNNDVVLVVGLLLDDNLVPIIVVQATCS